MAGIDRIYMMYFEEPGVAEREFEADVARSLRQVYHSASESMSEGQRWHPFVPPGKGLLDTTFDTTTPLPWLSDAELAEYAKDFTASGFRGFNWYRNLHRNWELMAPFAGAPIPQSSLLIAGARDGVIGMSGMPSRHAALKPILPGLRQSIIVDDVGHWVQQRGGRARQRAIGRILTRCGLNINAPRPSCAAPVSTTSGTESVERRERGASPSPL